MFYEKESVTEALNEILPSLLKLQAAGGSNAGEIVEAISNGKAKVFFCETGYIVAYINEEADGARTFFIWSAEASGKAFDTYMPWIEALAASQRCKYVGFHTTRKGFTRKLKNTGFKPVSVEYRKELYV